MVLKEFDLDLAYIEDIDIVSSIMKEEGCPHSQAIKLDYEANWKEKRRTFRLETRCISALYERVFSKMKTDNCHKILVECVEDIKEERIINLAGVYTVQVKLDYEDFINSSNYDKKQKALFLLMNGIKAVARAKEWSLEPFEIAHSKICEVDYRNEWIWKKAVKSADNKLSAEVLMQHEIKSMDISILIKDKNGIEIGRKKVISELPDEFAYSKHLGVLKWISSNEVTLVNKNGDVKWSFELLNK